MKTRRTLLAAALHAADALGADAMQGKSKTKPAAGAVQAVRAVNQYGKYFDHPGWKPLA
jgi:hypothetical protein